MLEILFSDIMGYQTDIGEQTYKMPKVDEEYIANKVTMILDAAYNICKKKPLYELTMKDVVEACYMSKGNIYRYFPDINAIIIAMVNRLRKDVVLSIEDIGLDDGDDSLTIITKMMDYIIDYLEENLQTLGKIQFELMVLMTCKKKKCDHLMEFLQEDAGILIFDRVVEELIKCVGEEKATEFATYFRYTLDGILINTIFDECYSEEARLEPKPVSTRNLLQLLKETAHHMISAALT